MKPIAISVIMANYNNANYIKNAIESVLQQTSKSWELLICDDASTDNSADIIAPYRLCKQIRFMQNPRNQGYTLSLKKLIEHAKNDIVAIVDSDDSLANHAVESILEAYKSHPKSGFVYSNFAYCDSELNITKAGYSTAIPAQKTNLHSNRVSHIKTFRKSAYDRTEGYDETILYAEDKDLIYKMEEVSSLYFVNDILYNYRVLDQSQSHGHVNSTIGITSHIRSITKAYSRRKKTGFANLTEVELLEKIQFHREKQHPSKAKTHIADPGGFVVCHKRKFMFIPISKNGLTSLKNIVLQQDYSLENNSGSMNPHNILGYHFDGYSRISLQDAKNPCYADYLKFSVYRDPVDRMLSLYRNKIAPGRLSAHNYFKTQNLYGVSLAEFLQFVETELTKPPILQDEHIRPQSQYYKSEDVDFVIALEDLDYFLENTMRFSPKPRLNKSTQARKQIAENDREIIMRLYKDDYLLQPDPYI